MKTATLNAWMCTIQYSVGAVTRYLWTGYGLGRETSDRNLYLLLFKTNL